jgi:hypothetical protein
VIFFLDIKEKKEEKETEIEYLGNKIVKIVRMKLNFTHAVVHFKLEVSTFMQQKRSNVLNGMAKIISRSIFTLQILEWLLKNMQICLQKLSRYTASQ